MVKFHITITTSLWWDFLFLHPLHHCEFREAFILRMLTQQTALPFDWSSGKKQFITILRNIDREKNKRIISISNVGHLRRRSTFPIRFSEMGYVLCDGAADMLSTPVTANCEQTHSIFIFTGESSSRKAENETEFLVDTATFRSAHTKIKDDGMQCNDAYIHGGEMKNWNELDFGCFAVENGSISQN